METRRPTGLELPDFKNKLKLTDYFINRSAVPGRNAKGDRLLLYLGIIDILQSYRLKKRLEHTFKSMITDGVNQFPFIHVFLNQIWYLNLCFRKRFRSVIQTFTKRDSLILLQIKCSRKQVRINIF